MQQLKSVVKHEFGHALGLGHYVADDIDVNVEWARGTVPAPSIMAVFTHQNLNNNFITTRDIVAVRSLYGENGFWPDQEEEKVFDSFLTMADDLHYLVGEFRLQSTPAHVALMIFIARIEKEMGLLCKLNGMRDTGCEIRVVGYR